MSNSSAHFFHTLPANSALTTAYGLGLIINSSGKALLAGANPSAFIGVAIDKPQATDQACPYQHTGLAEVVFGGVTAIGDLVTTDAAGKFVVATTGQRAVGRGYTVGAANVSGSVMLFGGGSFVLAP
jgi:hypothetical protein